MRPILIALLLAGCAGSPARTSALSPAELRGVDDTTLCRAATPREFYSPSPAVMSEVRDRRLNCANLYRYTPIPVEALIQPAPQPQAPPLPPPPIHCVTQTINGTQFTRCQ